MQKLTIHAPSVIRTNLRLITGLFIANCLTMISMYGFQRGRLYGLVPLFNVNREYNLPTFYSALNLIFVSILLAIIAIAHHRQHQPYRYWGILATIFGFLSIDEIISIHERFTEPISTYFPGTAISPVAWVVPYSIAIIILLTSSIKFLRQLPRSTRRQIYLAAAVFLLGAIGCELLMGIHIAVTQTESWLYGLLYTTEELCEMLGILIFIHALLTYISRHLPNAPFIQVSSSPFPDRSPKNISIKNSHTPQKSL
jgi:hypothetical protein